VGGIYLGRDIKLISQYKNLPKEVYVIFISRMVNSIGSFVYPLLALILTKKIGMQKDEAGIFITSIALFTAPGMIIGGKLVDKIGRKLILVIFQGLGAIIFILCGFLKPGMTMAYILMAAPIVSSVCSPAHDSMIADLTTPSNRKQAYSLLYMGHNLGYCIGPFIGGLLFENHLSIVFIGDGITTLLSLILILIFVKETKYRNDNEQFENEERVLEKNEEGSVFKVLSKRPILLIYAFILFFYQFAYTQWGFAIPMQLGDYYGNAGARYYGMMGAFNGFIVIVLTPLAVRLTHKAEVLKVISLGGLLYSISLGMLAFVFKLQFFFLSIFILTIGEIIITINSSTFVANNTPASHRGRINGILPLIYGAGGAVGPAVMGTWLKNYGYTTSWIIIGIIMLFASAFMRMLTKFKNRKE